MKDEKIAEEKYCKGCKLRMEQCLWAWRNTNGLNEPNEKNCSCKEVPAFLAGLKAGRPQWHDLRKDPNDLPEAHWKNWVIAVYDGGKLWCRARREECVDGVYWVNSYHYIIENVVMWAKIEIPTFDKE